MIEMSVRNLNSPNYHKLLALGFSVCHPVLSNPVTLPSPGADYVATSSTFPLRWENEDKANLNSKY